MKAKNARKMLRLCEWLISIVLIISMLPTNVLADSTEQINGIGGYVATLSSDPVTSTRPTSFGTSADDGRVWTDKSVSINASQFEITLSALAQEYVRTSTVVVKEQAAADVAIVIDLSSSMDADRILKMTGAVNKAIDMIMAANPKNRIGLYYFGLTSGTGTLLQLASYSTSSTGDGTDATNRYVKCSGQTFSRVAGVTQKLLDGGTSTTIATTVNVSAGTATQYGLYTAVNALTADVGARTKTSTDPERLPYLLLFTDGEANRAYTHWYSDLTNSDVRGTEKTGSGASGTAEISALTTLTASKLKEQLSQAYKTYNSNTKDAIWFNVAFGLSQGDNLATALLKPENVTSSSTGNLLAVYNQLNTYTTNAPIEYKKYGVNGNPGYIYTEDYIYFVQLSDMNALNQAFADLAALVEAATQEKIIPLQKVDNLGNPVTLAVTDVLGTGMELKTNPVFGTITGTVKSVSGTVTTYGFTNYSTTVDYNSTTREVKWNLVPDEIPLIMFSDRKNPTPGSYSNPTLAPVKLIYNVGLKDTYDSGTYYCNEYVSTSVESRFKPMNDNPYYYKNITVDGTGKVTSCTPKSIGTDITASLLKSSNITNTNDKVYQLEWVIAADASNNILVTKMGNNGKIQPKLQISKTPVAGSVVAGTNTSYTITITNPTSSAINNVVVNDTLPSGLTFVSGSIKEAGASKATATFPYTISSVPANSSIEITFNALVQSSATAGTEYVNSASITSVGGTALTTPAIINSSKVTVANTFTPSVTTKLDGLNVTGKTVELWKDGSSKYSLTENTGVHTKSGVIAGTYLIYVNGVNTGVTISDSDNNKVINYYSVSFYDGAAKYTDPATQIVLSGSKAALPTSPTKTGYTFNNWVTTNGGTTVFDFTNKSITSSTNVYAQSY